MWTRLVVMIGCVFALMVCVATDETNFPIPSASAGSSRPGGENGRKIERVLDSSCDVNFVNVSLKQAMESLGESMHIPISVDTKTLSDDGISVETTVTLQLKGVALRNVLNLLLEPMFLTFFVDDRTLNVTTQTVADQKYFTRSYSVAELIEPQRNDEPIKAYRFLVNAIQSTTGGNWEIENHDLEQTGPQRDAELEYAGLRSNGAISIAGTIQVQSDIGILEIRQTQKVHRKIQALLTGIRRAKRYAGYGTSGQLQTPSNEPR